ncbi:MAG: helix-turn-helix domain-containing protein, partial [Methanobacterium sp.]|nr:helix-turn-helix domain-containing protein [Methanobacterium sp.]
MSLAKWKEREREQRQIDIIKAARKLFADKGFDVSMDEIAKEVGLGKSTLYLY